jgi:hypothetical protein
MQQKYSGGWKPGDYAIYSDFGLRSLYILKVLPFEPEEARTVRAGSLLVGYAGHEQFDPESVRAEIVNHDLGNWDSGHRISSRTYQVGNVGFYNHTNLYRSIGDLIRHESNVLYSEVLKQSVENMQKDYGWRSLKKYKLDKWSPEDLKPRGTALRLEKAPPVLLRISRGVPQ